MNATEKYKKIFGKINSLTDELPWTEGLSNLLEHLLWDPRFILGISKTSFCNLIIKFLDNAEIKNLPRKEKEKKLKIHLTKLINESDIKIKEDEFNHYMKKPESSYCSPNEALRRSKFFSEDYLNKEFDVFLSLCSNSYLDKLYFEVMGDLDDIKEFKLGQNWTTHGNGGIFTNSLGLGSMQMDNLAYNENAKILIANELRLGGSKNPDQILKYAYLYSHLINNKFIHKDTKFLLLIIGDKSHNLNFKEELSKEIIFLQKKVNSGKNTMKKFIESGVLKIANNMRFKEFTWDELIKFNEEYLKKLSDSKQQVEKKLINGFNKSLREKAFMQKDKNN